MTHNHLTIYLKAEVKKLISIKRKQNPKFNFSEFIGKKLEEEIFDIPLLKDKLDRYDKDCASERERLQKQITFAEEYHQNMIEKERRRQPWTETRFTGQYKREVARAITPAEQGFYVELAQFIVAGGKADEKKEDLLLDMDRFVQKYSAFGRKHITYKEYEYVLGLINIKGEKHGRRNI